MLSEQDYIVVQEIIKEFTENGVTSIEMSFDVEQSAIQQSIIDAIIQDLAQYEDTSISVTGFQPSCESLLVMWFTLF